MPAPYDRLLELKATVDREELERAKIRYSEDFMHLAGIIEEALAKQENMLSAVPDSRNEFAAAKQDMIGFLQKEGLSAYQDVSAKFKERREVNAARVYRVIGGDTDLFVSLASITQVKLKDYAKSNPALKQELNDCVEVVARDVVDIAFPTQQ